MSARERQLKQSNTRAGIRPVGGQHGRQIVKSIDRYERTRPVAMPDLEPVVRTESDHVRELEVSAEVAPTFRSLRRKDG